MDREFINQENRLNKILLKYWSERRYITLENSNTVKQLKSNKISVNYNTKNSSWFFRLNSSKTEKIYCFGIDGHNDIKLILYANEDYSKSTFKFFKSGRIGVKIKFTGDKSNTYNFMNEKFIIKSPPEDDTKYYLMLMFRSILEVNDVIPKIISLLDFDYDSNNQYLLINNFHENKSTRSLSIKESEDINKPNDNKKYDSKILSQNEKIDTKQYNLSLNQLTISKFEFTEKSVDAVISKIDITNFIQEPSQDNLIEEIDEFMGTPIFKSITSDFDDFEISPLINKMKEDINDEKISGDVIDIINFYLDNYNSIKRHFCLNCSLDEFINDESFEKFIIYSKYENPVIYKITENIRKDIENDYINDEDELILKLKNYFKREEVKKDLYKEFEENKKRIPVLSIKFNLDEFELHQIFNSIEKDIENDKITNNSFKDHLDQKLEKKVELNQSKSRMKLNNVLKSDEVKEHIFNEEMFDELIDDMGRLINSNKIKSNEITEEYILKKIKTMGGL